MRSDHRARGTPGGRPRHPHTAGLAARARRAAGERAEAASGRGASASQEARRDGAGPAQPSDLWLTDQVATAIADAVRLNHGNEVFFLGVAEDGQVVRVEDVCRGNDHMVPVVRSLAAGFSVAIHNHPGGDLTPSDADLHIAAELADLGLGFFIVSNDGRWLNPVVRLFDRPPRPAPVSEDLVTWCFSPQGPLARRLAGYEPRAEQAEMARAVARALSEERPALVEAGTGTGKSLAYLIPALLRARSDAGQRVVIATRTIHLQEQLVTKDIPVVLSAWDEIEARASGGAAPDLPPPTVVLLKGRSHYACLRKVEDLQGAAESYFDSPAEQAEVCNLVRWARTSGEGSRESLPTTPTPGAWDKVQVDGDTCDRTACPYYQPCFYYRARREAAGATLVVTNHAMLLSDLAIRRETGFTWSAVLPPFRHVVLDEAHHLEDSAAEHLGLRLTSLGVLRTLGRLQRARQRRRGILPALCDQASKLDGGSALEREISERAIPARIRAEERAREAFAGAEALAAVLTAGGGDPGGGELHGQTARVRAADREGEAWRAFREHLDELRTALGAVARSLHRVGEEAKDLSAPGREALRGPLLEARGQERSLGRVIEGLRSFVREAAGSEAHVRWVETRPVRRRRRGGDRAEVVPGAMRVALRSAPLRVADVLREEIYPHLGAVLLTSATLAVGSSFRFLADRLGIELEADSTGGKGPRAGDASRRAMLVEVDDRRSGEPSAERPLGFGLKLPSPFAYASQALLGLVQDLPSPSARGFEPAIRDALLELAHLSGGGAFFLFTSHGQLQRAYRALERPLEARGIRAFCHGLLPRGELLRRFVAGQPAVLFGTDSFWEGVDVRGETLRMVVIVKLPFRVPTEPMQEARSEEIEAAGGSPFRQLALPQAALKLKQGFGRLIRSRTDRGAVVCLDRRLAQTGYGRVLLASLPPARRVRGPLSRVLEAIRPLVTPTRAPSNGTGRPPPV